MVEYSTILPSFSYLSKNRSNLYVSHNKLKDKV